MDLNYTGMVQATSFVSCQSNFFLLFPPMPRYQSMLIVEFVRSDAWLVAALAMQVWELVIHVIDEVEYVWK